MTAVMLTMRPVRSDEPLVLVGELTKRHKAGKLAGALLDEFNSKHPRAEGGPEGGQFVSGGGGLKSSLGKVKIKPRTKRDYKDLTDKPQAKESVDGMTPEKARERLANAEKMHGSDRSKWTEAQRKQASKLDAIARGEKPKTRITPAKRQPGHLAEDGNALRTALNGARNTRHVKALDEMGSVEDAQAYLGRLDKDELQELAQHVGLKPNPRASKKKLAEDISDVTVGGRLQRDSIMGLGRNMPDVAHGAPAGRKPSPTRGKGSKVPPKETVAEGDFKATWGHAFEAGNTRATSGRDSLEKYRKSLKAGKPPTGPEIDRIWDASGGKREYGDWPPRATRQQKLAAIDEYLEDKVSQRERAMGVEPPAPAKAAKEERVAAARAKLRESHSKPDTTKTPPPADELKAQLRSVKTADEGSEILESMKLTKPQWTKLARELDAVPTSRDSITELKNKIHRMHVSSRLDANAIRGGTKGALDKQGFKLGDTEGERHLERREQMRNAIRSLIGGEGEVNTPGASHALAEAVMSHGRGSTLDEVSGRLQEHADLLRTNSRIYQASDPEKANYLKQDADAVERVARGLLEPPDGGESGPKGQ